jgi:hypothetical protein
MAKTIVQRIGLDGGQQVKKELNDIGKTGADAFKKIQDAAAANDKLGRFSGVFDSIKAKAAEVGTAAQKLGQDFTNLGENITNSATKVGLLVTAVSGAVIGFGALVASSARANDTLADQAKAVGATARELHNLRGAAQIAGVEEGELQQALNKVAKAADESVKSDIELANKKKNLNRELTLGRITFAEYNKQLLDNQFQATLGSKAMDRLNISTKNADGTQKNQITLLKEVADAIKKMPEGFEKSAIAMEFFGKKGSRLASFMEDGAAGISKMEKEVERLAPALDDLAQEQAGKADDAFDQLKLSIKSAKDAFLQFFFPLQANLFTQLSEVIAANRGRIVELGAAISDKVKPVLDDLVKVLEGKQATEGGFVDRTIKAMVSLGTSADQAINGILIPAFQALLNICNIVAGAINGLFGTEITGGALAFVAVILKLTGTFGVITSAIKIVVSLFGVLAAVLGGAIPAAIAIVAAAFAIWLFNAVGGLKGLQTLWNTVWGAIASGFTALFITPVLALWNGFVAAIKAIWNGIVAVVTTVGAGIVSAWNAIVEGVKAVWNAIVDFFTALFNSVVNAIQGAWNAILDRAKACVESVKAAFNSGVSAINEFFKNLETSVISIFDKIIAKAKEVVTAAKKATSAANDIDNAGGGDGSVQAAGGGYIRGAGTSVSDSIRAWLSNGEFVQRAKAVRTYGRDFMAAINNLRISPAAVDALMGGVGAMSAAVAPSGNRFATGGLVTAGAADGGGARPFTLQLGDQLFGGMTATDNTIDRLQRYAATRSMRSAGRKPTWAG